MGDAVTTPATDCPPCPDCKATVATPAQVSGRARHLDEHADCRTLWCPACGHVWHEQDHRAVGQAWGAWAAWLTKQEQEAGR